MCEKVSDIKLKSPTHLYAVTLLVGTWLAFTGVAGAYAVDYKGMRSEAQHIIHQIIDKKPLDNSYHDDV